MYMLYDIVGMWFFGWSQGCLVNVCDSVLFLSPFFLHLYLLLKKQNPNELCATFFLFFDFYSFSVL